MHKNHVPFQYLTPLESHPISSITIQESFKLPSFTTLHFEKKEQTKLKKYFCKIHLSFVAMLFDFLSTVYPILFCILPTPTLCYGQANFFRIPLIKLTHSYLFSMVIQIFSVPPNAPQIQVSTRSFMSPTSASFSKLLLHTYSEIYNQTQ